MWKIDKPLLEEAIDDIRNIISESNGIITINDKPHISYIYRLYERNGGMIDEANNNRCRKEVLDKLESLYSNKTYEGKKFFYIRQALFRSADFCPMCGFGEPSQLDHYMPKSQYQSLSLCRLNLVPVCSVCNNKKRDKEYHLFLHPYYVKFPPNTIFLTANIHVNEHKHIFSWKYSINVKGLETELAEKINSQVSAIKLLSRLQRASNIFLSEQFCCMDFCSDKSLKDFLKSQMNKMIHLYGLNDWRSALLRALLLSSKFKKEEANLFAKMVKPANSGVNV